MRKPVSGVDFPAKEISASATFGACEDADVTLVRGVEMELSAWSESAVRSLAVEKCDSRRGWDWNGWECGCSNCGVPTVRRGLDAGPIPFDVSAKRTRISYPPDPFSKQNVSSTYD